MFPFQKMYDYWKNYKATSRLEAMKKQYYLYLAESKIKEHKQTPNVRHKK